MAVLRVAPAFVALVALGCGGDTTNPEGTGGGTAEACVVPSRVVDGRCLEPGVQDDGCPAGTLGQADGSCLPPGIPPELCAEGFVHDGVDACEPVLPEEPCPQGSMAVPGDDVCHPVMPCGSGTWGDAPIDAQTVFVDASFVGASDGGQSAPFTSLSEGVAAAPPGGLVAVAAGTYAEEVIIDQPVRIWGVCPDLVEVTASGNVAALDLRPGAAGTEIVGLAVTTTGSFAAVAVSGAQDVALERLWIHDAIGFGIALLSDLGPTSARIEDVLVEGSQDLGIVVASADAVLDGVLVRDTQPWVDGSGGRGIEVTRNPWQPGAGPASVALTRSVVERNLEAGLLVSGSEATIDGVVFRDSLPNGELGGTGIAVQADPDSGEPSAATLTGSLLQGSPEQGLFVSGAELVGSGLVLRSTETDDGTGRGIVVQAETMMGATATITQSVIEQRRDLGILVANANATLESLTIRGTLPRLPDQAFGRGISVQNDPQLGTGGANVTIRGSVIHDNHDIGIFAGGSNVTLTGVAVSGTAANASDGNGGHGLVIQAHPATATPAMVNAHGCLVEDNRESGVFLLGAEVWLSAVAVRATQPKASDGLFGDGILLGSFEGLGLATIESSAAEGNARAGLSNFGAHATLFNVGLTCNAVDLAGEIYADQSATFDDLGDNRCGCEDERVCAAASAGLTPPAPVAESP